MPSPHERFAPRGLPGIPAAENTEIPLENGAVVAIPAVKSLSLRQFAESYHKLEPDARWEAWRQSWPKLSVSGALELLVSLCGSKIEKGTNTSVFDIHYHLLFGVDDGPKTIEDSLALGHASIAEGVTHIVATPHANHRYTFQPEVNRDRIEILNQRLGDRLVLGLGCDFHISHENIECLYQDPSRYTINGRRYLLVEFADYAIPPSVTKMLYEMNRSGIVPIITHPERNPLLMSAPQSLREWIELGCLVQITAASICGDFNRKPKSMAMYLLRENLVHLVASDAHSIDWRPPSMKRAHSVLRERFGQEMADRLCIHNPRAVFNGELLPPQPEVEEERDRDSKRRGLLPRLFGR